MKKYPFKKIGRGYLVNPPNRFFPQELIPEEAWHDPEKPLPSTKFYEDRSQTIIAWNESPDLHFNASLNPYRGCEHGCAYCYARPTHEYFGLSAGLDFETKIFVKKDAPQLLYKTLAAPSWQPQVIAISGGTDPYQPIERELKITRQCLQVALEFRNPVAIVTKNYLVTRDLDILRELARYEAVIVYLSIPSLDGHLLRQLEPRTSHPQRRLKAISLLAEAGVPTGVLIAPVIPGLTDHEIPSILQAAAMAGARFASYILLRLPFTVAPLFEPWLEENLPDRKEKILNRIKALRSGKLNDPRFTTRQTGEGIFARQIAKLFAVSCRKNKLRTRALPVSTNAFRRPGVHRQLNLFE